MQITSATSFDPGEVDHRGRVAVLVTFVVLAFIVPLSAVIFIPMASPGLIVVAPLAVVFYAAVRLSEQVRRPSAQPITAMFWIFVYVFLGLAGLAQLWRGGFPSITASSPLLDVPVAYAAILLGLLSFDVGVRVRPSDGHGSRWLQRPVGFERVVVLGVIGLVCSAFVLWALGGAGWLFQATLVLQTRLDDVAMRTFHAAPVFGTILRVPISIAFVTALALITARRGQRRATRLQIILLVALGVVTAVVDNPVSTPRYWLGAVVVASILIVFPPINRTRSMAYVLGFVAIMLVVFPYADLYRRSTEVSIASRISGSNPYEELASKGDFDAVQQIAGAVGLSEYSGHTLGAQTMGVAFFWVPRAVWPGKPPGTGPIVSDFLRLSNRNVSMPLWGFLYLEGGAILVAVGMFLYGLLVRFIEDAYVGDIRAPTRASVLVPLFAGYQFYLLRGDPLPAVAYVVPAVLAIWFLGSSPRAAQTRTTT